MMLFHKLPFNFISVLFRVGLFNIHHAQLKGDPVGMRWVAHSDSELSEVSTCVLTQHLCCIQCRGELDSRKFHVNACGASSRKHRVCGSRPELANIWGRDIH